MIPYDHCHGNKETDLILHKKLKKKNIQLKFEEIFKSNLKYSLPYDFQKDSIEVIENDKFEILDAVKIFISGLKGEEYKIVQAKSLFKDIGKGTSIRYANSYVYKN